MIERLKSFKNENKILVMLSFFSIAIGLWGNFRQLWLQNTGLSVEHIGNVLSFGTLLCAMCAFVFASFLSPAKIKRFIAICLTSKIVVMALLFLCYQSSLIPFVKGLIVLDIITEQLIFISIYPLLVTIRRDNILYSKQKLVDYLFKDIGVLIGGIFVGRALFGMVVGYNVFLLVAIVFLMIALWVLSHTVQIVCEGEPEKYKKVMSHIFKDKVLRVYFCYYFIGNMAYSTALGLKMLMMTNLFDFSASKATNYFLIFGLLADGLGIFCLKYFTPKSDYVTIMIKFGIRFSFYALAFLSNNITVMLIAITWALLSSAAYENVTDAPYVNRVKIAQQFIFTYVRYVIGIVGTATGLFFSGLTYGMGVRYMLGLSAFFMLFQLGLACVLIYARGCERKAQEKESLNLIYESAEPS